MKTSSSRSHRFKLAFPKEIAVLMITLACWRSQAQAPINDAFDGRSAYTGALLSFITTNTSATAETGENPRGHRGTPAERSLWWNWKGLDGYVVVSTSNSPSLTRVAVYEFQKVLSQLTIQPNSGPPAILDRYEFSALPGVDYNIAVDGRAGSSGVIQLDLKVYTSPEILAQPTGATVTAGQRATNSVSALGKLPLTNQWQFSTLSPGAGFTNIVGNFPHLSIGSNGVVSKADQGWYRVIIRNGYGSVTSSVVRVDVNECAIPTLPQPLAIVTNVGRTVLFSASSLGTAPFYFQWQFKPVNQGSFVDLAGDTSSNLMFTNVSTDLAGQYRLLVSNIACTNQASTNVSLTVLTNNSLVLDQTYPTNLTLITNQNATFRVRVTEGYQPLGYQWWFTPVSGPSTTLAGETAPDLFLPGVQIADAGWYWAVVTNRYNVKTSLLARLIIELRPPNDNFANRIPIFPSWTNLSTTNLTITNVFGSNRNATPELPGEPRHQPSSDPRLSVWWSFTPPTKGHVIAELTSPDAPQVIATYTGYYVDSLTRVVNRSNWLDRFEFLGTNDVEYVLAVDTRNGGYSTNLSLKLTFNPNYDGPTILCQPGDCADGGGGDPDKDGDFTELGDPTTGCRTFTSFSVSATSIDRALYYQWQFGSTTNGPFADLPGLTNAALVVPNVTVADQGWYRAAVGNNGNTVVYSKAVHLTVNIGSIIATNGQPSSVSTNTCATAQFRVVTQSCSPMTFQWRHNGLALSVPNALGVNTTNLIITNLAPSNAGSYDVVIANANLSITSAVALLTLTNTPTIVSQPRSTTNQACQRVSFFVAATATCPLSYQWYFQGVTLGAAINSALSLTNVQPADGGGYSVLVSTPFAGLTSAVAQLIIRTNPVILQEPTDASVRACDIVNLDVQVQAGAACSPIS